MDQNLKIMQCFWHQIKLNHSETISLTRAQNCRRVGRLVWILCVCWGNVPQSKLYNLSVSWRLGSFFFFLLRGRPLRHERCLIWLLLLSFCPEWSIYGLATCVRSQPTVSVGPSCGLCFSALSDATRNFWYELTFSLLAPNSAAGRMGGRIFVYDNLQKFHYFMSSEA